MAKHTQTIRRQQATNCLSVFDHFVELALKELRHHKRSRTKSFLLQGIEGVNNHSYLSDFINPCKYNAATETNKWTQYLTGFYMIAALLLNKFILS